MAAGRPPESAIATRGASGRPGPGTPGAGGGASGATRPRSPACDDLSLVRGARFPDHWQMPALFAVLLAALLLAQFESVSHAEATALGHPGWHDGLFEFADEDGHDPDSGDGHCCHAAAHLGGLIVERAEFPALRGDERRRAVIRAPGSLARPPPLPPPIS